MIISLFSSSTSCKNFSKSLNNSMLEFGGLYHVAISSGLLLGFTFKSLNRLLENLLKN